MKWNKARKALMTFSLAAFLNDVGAHIIRPLWPAFITIVLGAPASFLGFIDGLGQSTAAVSRYPAGRWADMHKKKPLIWLGYLFGGLSRLGYAISTFASMLIPFHILDRAGKGVREPSRDALLAQYYKKKRRGAAFGILEAVDHVGSIVGPLVGLALFAILSYRYTFAIAAIPSIVGAIVIWAVIKEVRRKKARVRRIKFKFYPKEFKVLTAVSALFALSWFSVSFFILYASKVGLPIILLPIFYLSFTVFTAITCIPAGRLSDRIGRKPVMLLGFILFSISCLGFAFVKEIWALSLSSLAPISLSNRSVWSRDG